METLIGLVIFALIGIIVMTSLAMTARSNMTNSNLTRAESLARTELEYVRNLPYNFTDNPPVYATLSLPTGFSYDNSEPMAKRINIDGSAATADTGFQQIRVGIKYSNNLLFTVTSYKVNR